MDETLIWCALIGAVAYVTRAAFPSYYELTKVRQDRLEAINNAVDDNEQVMLGMGEELEALRSDVAGHLSRMDDLNKTVEHNCLRLATLEEQMWKAKTAAPANETRHD